MKATSGGRHPTPMLSTISVPAEFGLMVRRQLRSTRNLATNLQRPLVESLT
jgi:hypothetical protein